MDKLTDILTDQLSVVCVQTGNYLGRGAEYVHKLRLAVKRHLTLPHKFYVVTDDAASIYPGMTVKPSALPGWWEKLRLFKPGMFPDGRVLFLDLDTLITANIDEIARFDVPFATLRDFWRPNGLGPAVMIWHTDVNLGIWEAFEKSGKMNDPRGDQGFLESIDDGRFRQYILQDVFPGCFASYKTHCTNGLPDGVSVVCFHGKPRPHEVGGWAKEIWNG